ncbi:MAG TPA: hypothetical protein VGN34_02860, partial [Ktedonobacteraceae bacterium]
MAIPAPPLPRVDATINPADSDTIDDGAKSPTTLILNFLRSKGMPANGANIRTVLEQNAREP